MSATYVMRTNCCCPCVASWPMEAVAADSNLAARMVDGSLSVKRRLEADRIRIEANCRRRLAAASKLASRLGPQRDHRYMPLEADRMG